MRAGYCFVWVISISEHAGQFLHFCQPASIFFLFVFNSKFHFDYLSLCDAKYSLLFGAHCGEGDAIWADVRADDGCGVDD